MGLILNLGYPPNLRLRAPVAYNAVILPLRR